MVVISTGASGASGVEKTENGGLVMRFLRYAPYGASVEMTAGASKNWILRYDQNDRVGTKQTDNKKQSK